MTSPITPRVLALIIADSVKYDEATRKYNLIGTYNTINSTRFPAVHHRMELYLLVDNVRVSADIMLRVVDVGGVHEPVFTMKTTLTAGSPTDMVEQRIVTHFAPEFPQEGQYAIEVVFGGDAIYSRRIYLNLAT